MSITRPVKMALLTAILCILSMPGLAAEKNFYTAEQCSPFGACDLIRPLFKWPELQTVDKNLELISPSFCLEVATDKKFSKVVYPSGTFTTTRNEHKYDLKANYILKPGVTYYWRIAPGTSSIPYAKRFKWSPPIEFVVMKPQPKIIAPEANVPLNTICPIFKWKEVEDAEGYEIQVSETQDFSATMGGSFVYHFYRQYGNEWRWRLHRDIGPDEVLGTEDDFNYFAFYFPHTNLVTGKNYFYRFRVFMRLSRSSAKLTEFVSDVHSFSINSAPTSNEILTNIQPLTKTPDYAERCPAASLAGKKLSYARLRETMTPEGRPYMESFVETAGRDLRVHPQDLVYFYPGVESEIWYKEIQVTNSGVIVGQSSNPLSTAIAGSRDIQPSWDPPGNSAAFASTRATKDNFVIVSKSIDSSVMPRLAESRRDMAHPQFSHDGKWLTYAETDDGGEWYIWVVNLESPIKKQLCKGSNPSWSPDDSKLVFEINGVFFNSNIYVIGADGTGLTQLTQDEKDVLNISPQFSPNGKKVLFASNKTGNFDLYTVDPKGNFLKQVTNFLGDDLDPCWINDTCIAFASTRENNWDIWIGQIP